MPAPTIGQACDRAQRLVSWNKPENWPMELDRLVVANEVGEWLVNCEPWNWLRRPSTLLSIVAAQQYIALPSDFGRIVGNPESVSGSVYRVKMADQNDVDRRRRLPPSGGTFFTGVILYSAPTASAAPEPRLEIGPIPSASASNVIRLSYIATWRPCTGENDVIPVPTWFVGLYIRALSLYLAGWERDKDRGRFITLEERLGLIRDSDLYQAAVDRDDTIQCDMGPMHGSAEEMIRGGDGDVFYSDQSGVPVIGT